MQQFWDRGLLSMEHCSLSQSRPSFRDHAVLLPLVAASTFLRVRTPYENHLSGYARQQSGRLLLLLLIRRHSRLSSSQRQQGHRTFLPVGSNSTNLFDTNIVLHPQHSGSYHLEVHACTAALNHKVCTSLVDRGAGGKHCMYCASKSHAASCCLCNIVVVIVSSTAS